MITFILTVIIQHTQQHKQTHTMLASIVPLVAIYSTPTNLEVTPLEYAEIHPQQTLYIFNILIVLFVIVAVLSYTAFFSMLTSFEKTMITANKAIDAYVIANKSK